MCHSVHEDIRGQLGETGPSYDSCGSRIKLICQVDSSCLSPLSHLKVPDICPFPTLSKTGA